MKKLTVLLTALLLTLLPNKVHAISCSGSATIEVGQSVSVSFYDSRAGQSVWWSGDLNYDSSKLTKTSGNDHFDVESNDLSLSYSFTAYQTGTAVINLQGVNAASSDDSSMYIENGSSDSCTINIVEATRPNNGNSSTETVISNNTSNDNDNSDKSSNSYLKKLSIEKVKISPVFDKDKMEYTAIVDGSVDKINITGELDDGKASVEGLGEKELKEGINKFEIKVTAENTEVRTYVITVTRKEENPIEVVINKKKYTISKKDMGLKIPDGFVKTTLVIEKQEVEAYSNSYTGYIIVQLVDEDGNAGWYVYNKKNSTYSKYSEFTSDNIRLVLLKPNSKDVPHKYKKTTFLINNEEVEGYALETSSPFRLVYALNMKTGEKNFYLYDMDENTFQRFYDKQVSIYRDLIKKFEIGVIGLGSIILIMFVIILCQSFVNKKTKKFIKNNGRVEKEEVVVEEDEDDEKEEELSKTMIKRNKKQRKKELEQERKDFFDL